MWWVGAGRGWRGGGVRARRVRVRMWACGGWAAWGGGGAQRRRRRAAHDAGDIVLPLDKAGGRVFIVHTTRVAHERCGLGGGRARLQRKCSGMRLGAQHCGPAPASERHPLGKRPKERHPPQRGTRLAAGVGHAQHVCLAKVAVRRQDDHLGGGGGSRERQVGAFEEGRRGRTSAAGRAGSSRIPLLPSRRRTATAPHLAAPRPTLNMSGRRPRNFSSVSASGAWRRCGGERGGWVDAWVGGCRSPQGTVQRAAAAAGSSRAPHHPPTNCAPASQRQPGPRPPAGCPAAAGTTRARGPPCFPSPAGSPARRCPAPR